MAYIMSHITSFTFIYDLYKLLHPHELQKKGKKKPYVENIMQIKIDMQIYTILI